MSTRRQSRRQRHGATKSRPRQEQRRRPYACTTTSPTTSWSALILLRLDSSVSLVRAASSCRRWCRVAADAGFLARFRLRVRVPLVLGHYHNFVHPRPVFALLPPSSPGQRSSTPIRQSFSLDFVPEFRSGSWEVVDSRDRFLLLRNNKWRNSSSSDPDLVVCEPKTQRYQLIAMPGGNLMSSSSAHLLGQFLLRGGATSNRHGGELSASMSNFKVLLVVLRRHMLDSRRGVPGARVFSGTKCSWREVPCAWTGNIDVPRTAASFYFAGRANACLYWGIKGGSRADALVLDETTAGVSLEALPECMEGWTEAWCFRVVGREDGALRALRLTEGNLRVFCRRLEGGGEWVFEKLVRLPKECNGILRTMIVAAHETYKLVRVRHSWGLFCVDLKTMALERVQERRHYPGPGFQYELPWPPILKP